MTLTSLEAGQNYSFVRIGSKIYGVAETVLAPTELYDIQGNTIADEAEFGTGELNNIHVLSVDVTDNINDNNGQVYDLVGRVVSVKEQSVSVGFDFDFTPEFVGTRPIGR